MTDSDSDSQMPDLEDLSDDDDSVTQVASSDHDFVVFSDCGDQKRPILATIEAELGSIANFDVEPPAADEDDQSDENKPPTWPPTFSDNSDEEKLPAFTEFTQFGPPDDDTLPTFSDTLPTFLNNADDHKVPTFTEIDTECDDLDHCDICRCALGSAADPGTRAFRCFTCTMGVQCETCCSQSHLLRGLGGQPHVLQEWHNIAREWGPEFGIEDVMASLRKEWEAGWRRSTLAEQGMVYHFGHAGRPCLWPKEPASTLMVIARTGMHKIQVKYCGCGDFERGALGEWQQIRAAGWHRAGLITPGICATYPILSGEAERSYQPRAE
ncbi:hypothetical protein C8R46DRAFT_1050808 [Mycena filopes]|nr:hypothetical protein C8R46DRAFT_1050808 [Mycena filopes]